ncbi:MAG: thioredoxin family protein [Patescibacteria group bacterium]
MKVLKFGAVWCNGCLVMRPRWAEIEKENPWLKTEYFDYDQDIEEVEKYHIESGVLPVFIFLDSRGKELLRLSGEIEKKDLVENINKLKTL